MGLRRLRCDAPRFDRYRAVLWLYWRQTEDDSGVHAGRPQHGPVAGVVVSALQLHVRHHRTRSAGRDVPVRHAVLDGVGRLRHRNAHSGLRLHSRLLQPPPDQRLWGELLNTVPACSVSTVLKVKVCSYIAQYAVIIKIVQGAYHFTPW